MRPLQDCSNTGGCAWKSIAVCYSSDNGTTWTAPEVILDSPAGRPKSPTFGGCGDFCVVKARMPGPHASHHFIDAIKLFQDMMKLRNMTCAMLGSCAGA
jgi:hypothetical protein